MFVESADGQFIFLVSLSHKSIHKTWYITHKSYKLQHFASTVLFFYSRQLEKELSEDSSNFSFSVPHTHTKDFGVKYESNFLSKLLDLQGLSSFDRFGKAVSSPLCSLCTVYGCCFSLHFKFGNLPDQQTTLYILSRERL